MTEDSRRFADPEPPSYSDGWQGFPSAGRGYDRSGQSFYEYVPAEPADDRVGLTYDGFVRPRPSAENDGVDGYDGYASPGAGDSFATPDGGAGYDGFAPAGHGYQDDAGYGYADQPDAGYADAGYANAGYADAAYTDAGYADAGYDDAGNHYAADPEATFPGAAYPDAPASYPQDAYGPFEGDQGAAGGFQEREQGAAGPYSEPDPYSSYPDARATEQIPAATPGQLIDLSVPRAAPVTHRGERRRHAAVLATVAVAVMIAGGVGYVLFRPDGEPQTTANPAIITTDGPTSEPDETLDLFPDPSGDPVQSASASPTPSSAAPSTSATSRPTTAVPRLTTAPATGPATPISGPDPTLAPTRPGVAPTDALQPKPPAAPSAPLTASFNQQTGSDGAFGSVRVSNPGSSPANGFTVRITVPGGGDVSVISGNVSVSQSGESVTFRGNGSISAGGSVTFSFAVDGPVSGQLGGCSIDGNSCS